MFAPDTNMLYTNLTQAKGDYKTFFYLSRNAYLMLEPIIMPNGFWNPNIHLAITHPPTLIWTLFGFWNPLKKMDDP